jgi:hypothetical protein
MRKCKEKYYHFTSGQQIFDNDPDNNGIDL